MNKNIRLAFFGLAIAGCTFVGNSPEERRHRQVIQQEEESFNRQKYERRYAAAVQETEAYHSFTNRLCQRDTEPMDLAELGKVMVEYFGTNVAWQIVITAYGDYSHGAKLDNATNAMWLVSQSPRTRDTAWMINYRREWTVPKTELPPLAAMAQKRDGTNYIGVYLGMIAEHDGRGGVMMYSATSGECLKYIPFQDFEDSFVTKTKPEYPPSTHAALKH